MDIQKMIMDSVQDKIIAEVSQKTGLSGDMAGKAMKVALPMLMGAISRNTDSEEGKLAFDKALESHDETNELDAVQGGKILKHILGSDEASVEEKIALEAGVSKEEATGMTKLLAPFLMGKLWAAKKGWEDVAGMFSKDTVAKSLLTSFLDKNGDGDVKDDLMKMGMNAIKKKFLG